MIIENQISQLATCVHKRKSQTFWGFAYTNCTNCNPPNNVSVMSFDTNENVEELA